MQVSMYACERIQVCIYGYIDVCMYAISIYVCNSKTTMPIFCFCCIQYECTSI